MENVLVVFFASLRLGGLAVSAFVDEE